MVMVKDGLGLGVTSRCRSSRRAIGGDLPRIAIVGAMAEHMAHHRGALSVYARLLGYAPPMPYADA